MDLATRVRALKHRGLSAVAVAAVLGIETNDVLALLADPAAAVALPVPQYKVFETTDLLVPAGTDWSVAGHVIGTFSVQAPPVGSYVGALHIEAVASPGAGDDLLLSIGKVGSGEGLINCQLGTPNLWAVANGASIADNFAYDFFDQTAPLPASLALEARIKTFGATTVDQTVVRARAALLIV